jgi:hypothetical protein
LQDKFDEKYGPGLAVSDYNLGILYMLAVSSLSTYGILLAGLARLIRPYLLFINFNITIPPFIALLWLLLLVFFLFIGTSSPDYLLSSSAWMSYRVRAKIFEQKTQSRPVCITRSLRKPKNSSDLSQYNPPRPEGELLNYKDFKALHSTFIKELYRDREAPVIPFRRDLILATCYNCLDKKKKSEFLKELGSKSCIYLIEYKYDPLIYYIGRTTLLKRRLAQHLKHETDNKLHVFWKLVG